jgi:hypothetical protein
MQIGTPSETDGADSDFQKMCDEPVGEAELDWSNFLT